MRRFAGGLGCREDGELRETGDNGIEVPSMKRSVGVMVWAILLMVAGLLAAAGGVVSMATASRALDVLAQQMRQVEALPAGTEQGQMPPERLEIIRRRYGEATQEVRQVVASPAVRINRLLSIALGVAAAVAGVGLLRLKGWALRLVWWQAGLSIPLGLYAIWSSPNQRFSEALLRFYGSFVDPGTQTRMREALQAGQSVGQWAGVLAILVWNGLLIWYFSRASVRRQFASMSD